MMFGSIALGILLLAPATESTSRTVFAEKLYTSTGETIEGAVIRIEGGKIAAIAPSANAPSGDEVLRAAVVTAGMIDPSVRIHTGASSVEQSREVEPQRRVASAIDLFDYRWMRQTKSGVTTVLVAPLDRNVVGGLGIVLKTAGDPTFSARTVKADAVLRGAIGGEPSSDNRPAPPGGPTNFYARRPTTRMGVEWEWRRAFFDAAVAERLPERDFPGSEILRTVLRGELTLCIQAWTTQDIRTAVFLAEELEREGFGTVRLIVDSAAEAWIEPDLLMRIDAQVVLPPFPSGGRTGPDKAFMSWNVAKMLQDAGVRIALSSHGARSASGRLGLQAGYAMRGGLTFEEALAAVTINPARMLGVEDRVGSVEVGKDADLVLWSGTPFEPASRVTAVLVDGALVVDTRKQK